MIFISGIHGAGKSYFTERIKEQCNIVTYSASTLIANYKGYTFKSDKKVDNISSNQQILSTVIKEKRITDKEEFLLDGHFCLLNKNNEITRIGLDTFIELSPNAIILITELPEIIVERRKTRDNVRVNIETTMQFQNEEIACAKEVANILKIPLFISKGSADINNAINFLFSITKEE
ncbi:ATP-binding protein [Anaerocolumna sp. AGMB13025]|uniref:ATP-binding protein n=1 Tax=Anaerocolumna sp. AGMB13025 TaxID=3039116 RepID=UPI002420201D|nr:ATP-binding protein [Anaerocolumna sp. AGMB13025]WFR55398.1 ATP-binding protein [Anaerocolumna sp. AGMB13025]